MRRISREVVCTCGVLVAACGSGVAASEPGGGGSGSAWERIAPFFAPPAEFADDFGEYRSPLVFNGGRRVESAEQWPARRREIVDDWHALLGPWPPVIEQPEVEYAGEEPRDGFTQHTVRFEIAPGHRTSGYLLVPDRMPGGGAAEEANVVRSGDQRFPAVVVVYYEPETAVGLKGENRDFALQLARRGFVALSIGLGSSLYYPSRERAELQPLSALAYGAANAWHVLASRDDVDSSRIGIVGHSYGGKWAMFASCLYERFACGVWCDGGIVFDERRGNVNYWEPWYLGYAGPEFRKAGIPSEANPRTGAYARLIARGRDLHELHALMAPRPFLVSGGSEDPPERWQALNHAIAVNRLLGCENRVAMTNRPRHAPTPESNEQIYAFFEHFLHDAPATAGPAAAAPANSAMVFPGKTWDEAPPASQGVDAAKLDAAIEHLRARVGRDGVRELVVVRNGRLIWKGDNIDHRHGVWSVTKSFTSTVLGLLIDDGQATLDTKAGEHLPALADHFSEVTLRHFTTMTSGYRAGGDEPQGGYLHGPSRTPFTPAGTPLFAPPGSQYAYWDSAMNQFAHVLTRIAGEPLREVFRRRIAEPIGMDPEAWTWGDFGEIEGVVVNGGAGNQGRHVQISARELARLGHLYLHRGRWDGRQLLSAEWVAAATRPQVPASHPWAQPESKIDGRGVYGFNWWTNTPRADGPRKWPAAPPGTFAAAGFNNNKCFVVPEWNMVIVRLGLDGNVEDDVWNEFFERLAEAVEDDHGGGVSP